MIVAILGTVVTVLVFFCVWLTIQLSKTQTVLLEINDLLGNSIISLAEGAIELEEDIKGIEEDLAQHIRSLAIKLEEETHNTNQNILEISAEFRKDFLNREKNINLKVKQLEELIKS